AHSSYGRGPLWSRAVAARESQSPGKPPDPGAVCGHVLGALAAKLLLLGLAGGQNGPLSFRAGMASGPDSDGQPAFRSRDAAAFFLCPLSRHWESGPGDPPSKIWRWSVYG